MLFACIKSSGPADGITFPLWFYFMKILSVLFEEEFYLAGRKWLRNMKELPKNPIKQNKILAYNQIPNLQLIEQ